VLEDVLNLALGAIVCLVVLQELILWIQSDRCGVLDPQRGEIGVGLQWSHPTEHIHGIPRLVGGVSP